ncbi:hypothetical protein FUAX_11430 [Fulvitalea axinellae]|uniref:Uncharacterized protein n=1 Tax=Fulvitalea axinellae TaxID=1182444 RepID=A0AAU9D769_9BACT|nr:hypothetical protein FUAX_11430 [Fulvitalea axinellae]
MSRIGTMDLKGASGKHYTFNVYSFENTFTEKQSGVYVVTHRNVMASGNTDHALVYAGVSSNLHDTFTDHPLIEEFNKENANCILAYWEDHPDTRELIREDLVNLYHPPCNINSEKTIH